MSEECHVTIGVSAPSALIYYCPSSLQKVGAKAVTGVFRTVAREVAEAEASLRPVKERHMAKAMRTWADLLTERTPPTGL
jgi:hypothetical protein